MTICAGNHRCPLPLFHFLTDKCCRTRAPAATHKARRPRRRDVKSRSSVKLGMERYARHFWENAPSSRHGKYEGLAGAITIVKQKTGRKLKSQMHLEQHAWRSKVRERERKSLDCEKEENKVLTHRKIGEKKDEATASAPLVIFSVRFERVRRSSPPATYI